MKIYTIVAMFLILPYAINANASGAMSKITKAKFSKIRVKDATQEDSLELVEALQQHRLKNNYPGSLEFISFAIKHCREYKVSRKESLLILYKCSKFYMESDY
ncbi:hypothetical protein OAB57_04080, partial [Bacteriovoracaceae bacterium]|nr:hypothetical protein [Bacteriovoracaceae bacterium]